MTPVAAVCIHCNTDVIITRSALTGRAVTLSTHPLDRLPDSVDWALDQAGYAYPSEHGTHNTHSCAAGAAE